MMHVHTVLSHLRNTEAVTRVSVWLVNMNTCICALNSGLFYTEAEDIL